MKDIHIEAHAGEGMDTVAVRAMEVKAAVLEFQKVFLDFNDHSVEVTLDMSAHDLMAKWGDTRPKPDEEVFDEIKKRDKNVVPRMRPRPGERDVQLYDTEWDRRWLIGYVLKLQGDFEA